MLPFESKSHFTIGHAIVKSLQEAGHDLIVISPYPKKEKQENYREISTADILEEFQKSDKEKMEFMIERFHFLYLQRTWQTLLNLMQILF